jgi:hypothetical protein
VRWHVRCGFADAFASVLAEHTVQFPDFPIVKILDSPLSGRYAGLERIKELPANMSKCGRRNNFVIT